MSCGVRSEICVSCGATQLRRCANCQKAKYCSEECQRAHWKVINRTPLYSLHTAAAGGPQEEMRSRI